MNIQLLSNKSSEFYDPYQIPPNLYFSKLHQKSQILGICSKDKKTKTFEKCPCCNMSTDKVPFSIFCKLEDLRGYVGFSHYIFLKLIKQMIFMLMIPYYFIVGTTHIALHILESDNTDRVYFDRLMADIIFLLYFYCFCYIYLPLWVNKQIKSYHKYNKSISGMTVLVENLPEKWTKQELHNFFERRLQFKVKTVIPFKTNQILKNMSEKVHKISIKKYKMKLEMNEIINKPINKKGQKRLKCLNQKIKKFNDSLESLILESSSMSEELESKSSNIAFLILEDSDSQQRLIKIWPNNFIFRALLIIFQRSEVFTFHGKFLTLHQAPDPNEIIVDNVGFSNIKRFLISFLLFLLGLCFLMFSYFILIGLNFDGTNDSALTHSVEKYLPGVLTLVFSKIIKESFLFLSTSVKFQTRSEYERYCLKFILVCQFILSIANTFLKVLLMEVLANIIYLMTDSGLSFLDLLDIFIHYYTPILAMMTFIPLVHLLNFHLFYKFYQRYRMEKNPNKIMVTQEKCNFIYENPELKIIEFYLDYNYIYVLEVFMWPIFPLWIGFSIVHFGLLYCVFKWVLLKRSKINKQHSQSTFYDLIKVTKNGPFLYSFSLFFLNLKYTIFLETDHSYDKRILACGVILTITLFFGLLSFCCGNSRTLKVFKVEEKQNVKFENLSESQQKEYNVFGKI